jgi:inosose dehydratase
MNLKQTRREFLSTLAAVSASYAIPGYAAPAIDHIQYGYAAITWNANDHQAIEDIAAVGYPGIQLRANAIAEFKPDELKDLLAQHKLTFVALSSTAPSLDTPEDVDVARQVTNAKFARAAGALYLQLIDQNTVYPRTVTPDECRRLGQRLTAIGKRTADLGIPIGYHNHLTTISERPENLDLVLEASDPKYVKLELDTAHYVAGGGDPVKAIERYHDRLLFLHLKDVVALPAGTANVRYPFEFVELGRGRVDLPAVFKALHKVRYKGWAVVELDRVPDAARTPKECAIISRDYLTQKIGAKV